MQVNNLSFTLVSWHGMAYLLLLNSYHLAEFLKDRLSRFYGTKGIVTDILDAFLISLCSVLCLPLVYLFYV